MTCLSVTSKLISELSLIMMSWFQTRRISRQSSSDITMSCMTKDAHKYLYKKYKLCCSHTFFSYTLLYCVLFYSVFYYYYCSRTRWVQEFTHHRQTQRSTVSLLLTLGGHLSIIRAGLLLHIKGRDTGGHLSIIRADLLLHIKGRDTGNQHQLSH